MNDKSPYGQPSVQSENSENNSPESNSNGPRVYHSEIDPKLKEIALQQIQNAVKGNGLKPENIEVTKFEGETLEFLALTELTLNSTTSTKRQAGKITGPILLQNTGMFQDAINKECHKITHSPDILKRIYDAVLNRKDKGLYLENVKIKLPFLHKDFVAHEQCNPCAGQGNIQCVRCHGKGEQPCPHCNARGVETCPACGGRQYIQRPNNQNQQCMRCNGSGRTACTQCHESKTIQCNQCNASGTIQCNQCGGHAWNSIIAMTEINAIAHYNFDRENIPEPALKKIDDLQSNIQHHSEIKVIHKSNEQEKEHGDITIPYHFKVPMAQIVFKIKTLNVPAFLFGTQGTLYDTPPFLEKIMGPGIKALKLAAHGQGNVENHLQKAGRYKTLKHLILTTSRTSLKKALESTLKENPIGLSKTNTKKLVMMAKTALGHIGKRPKQNGYIIGAATAVALGLGYYFIGRPIILEQLSQQNLKLGADIAFGILSLGAGAFAAKIYTKQKIRKALEALLAKK